MPTSIDPQPGEDELECARCGAYFYYGLTRCPQCGVNIYEPDEGTADDYYEDNKFSKVQSGLFIRFRNFIRRLTGKPYSAEEVFGNALDQAFLYDDLLRKSGGDEAVVERLIAFEEKHKPGGNRLIWLQNAVQRWERDNRAHGSSK